LFAIAALISNRPIHGDQGRVGSHSAAIRGIGLLTLCVCPGLSSTNHRDTHAPRYHLADHRVKLTLHFLRLVVHSLYNMCVMTWTEQAKWTDLK